MRLTKLLREAREQSKCSSNSISEAYKKILGMFSQPDQFAFYIREEIKQIRAQEHFRNKGDRVKVLEEIVEDMATLNAIVDNPNVKSKYGEFTNLKKEIAQNISDYTERYQAARKITDSTKKEEPKQKTVGEVFTIAKNLCEIFEREKYCDSVLAIICMKVGNTREGLKIFNEDYAEKIGESKYEGRKDWSMLNVESWNDFTRASVFEAGRTNFSLDFKDEKRKENGVIVGNYRVRAVMRKKIQSNANYSTPDLLRLETEMSALKNLEKTDYVLLKENNKGRFERVRNSEFLSEIDKVLQIISHAFDHRAPRQEVSKLLSQYSKLLYDEIPNPDTDYFKLKGENYTLTIGVKAKGKVDDHKVYVSMEYKKL